MKRVIIVRHAKSVPYGYDDDFNRDLKYPRGFSDAAKVSGEFRKQQVFPDLIISSPAKRALKTAMIFADTFDYPLEKIRKEEDLYEGISTNEFIKILHNIPDEMNVVYIFGHNPTVYYLIKGLLPKFCDNMPTCSSVAIEFKTDRWESIKSGSGDLGFHLAPVMLK